MMKHSLRPQLHLHVHCISISLSPFYTLGLWGTKLICHSLPSTWDAQPQPIRTGGKGLPLVRKIKHLHRGAVCWVGVGRKCSFCGGDNWKEACAVDPGAECCHVILLYGAQRVANIISLRGVSCNEIMPDEDIKT